MYLLSNSAADMQRFQVPYNLKAIPEVQEYLSDLFQNSRHHGDLQDLYRRRYLHSTLLLRPCSYSILVCWSNQNNRLMRLLWEICASCSIGRHGLSRREHPHFRHFNLASTSFYLSFSYSRILSIPGRYLYVDLLLGLCFFYSLSLSPSLSPGPVLFVYHHRSVSILTSSAFSSRILLLCTSPLFVIHNYSPSSCADVNGVVCQSSV